MARRAQQYCDRHKEPVRMLPQMIGRWPQPQVTGGIHAAEGSGQTIWTCPTCRDRKVTSP